MWVPGCREFISLGRTGSTGLGLIQPGLADGFGIAARQHLNDAIPNVITQAPNAICPSVGPPLLPKCET